VNKQKETPLFKHLCKSKTFWTKNSLPKARDPTYSIFLCFWIWLSPDTHITWKMV